MNENPSPILITGMALASSLGVDRESTWQAVLAGKSGFGPMTAMESPLPPGKDGAQAVDLPADFAPDLPREARYLKWTIAAAIRDAGLTETVPYDPGRCAILLGTTLHGMRAGGEFLRTNSYARLKNFPAGATLKLAAAELPFTGAGLTTCSACSSSLGSIALAVTLLQTHQADCVIAGGYDTISEYVYGGFNSLRLVADGPLRPFSKDRKGMKLAEGYGIVVLERMDDFARRLLANDAAGGDAGSANTAVSVTRPHAIAQILGWGESADAHHLTQPHPTGDGAARAMSAALARANLPPAGIDLIAAHATGTPDNDAGEFAALSRVFGDDLPRVPVVGFKSHLGHTLGGAGAVELILSALALRDQIVPACANITAADLEFPGLNVSTGSAKPATIRATLNTSLGFGGANTCVILARPDENTITADPPDGALPLSGGERAGVRGETSQVESVSSAGRPKDFLATDPRSAVERFPPHPASPLRGEENGVRATERFATSDKAAPHLTFPGGRETGDHSANPSNLNPSGTTPSLPPGESRSEGDRHAAPLGARPHLTSPGGRGTGNNAFAREVFITGLGVIAPGVLGREGLLARLDNPQSLAALTLPIAESDLEGLLNARRIRRMSDYVKLQLAAATLACRDAGLAIDSPEAMAAFSAILGSAHGSATYSYNYYEQIVREGVMGANPMLFAEGVPNAGAAHISLMLGLKGACQAVIGTRTAGLDALALAATRIASGEWDRAIVGAGEEDSDVVRQAYRHAGLATESESAGAFGGESGFLCAGGAAALVLESRGAVEARGGKPIAAIDAVAFGRSSRESLASTAANVLKQLGSPQHVLTSAAGTCLDGAEAAALRETGATEASSIYGHVAETFSATPLIGIAAVIAAKALPRLLSPAEQLRPIASADGENRIDRFGAICTDVTGLVSGVSVRIL